MSTPLSFSKEFVEIRNNVKFEFLKNYRTKKLLTIVIISAGLGLLFFLIPLLTGSDYPESNTSYMSNVLRFTDVAFILFALFLGADAINREHSDQTDLLIYPLPQRRSNVIISKYISQLATSWLGIYIYYGVTAFSMIYVYGGNAIPAEFITSILFSMLYMSTVLAFAFFLSAIFKGTAASMTLTFFGIQILLPLLTLLLSLADIDISWIFVNYSSLTTAVIGLGSSGGFPGTNTTVDFDEGVFQLTIQTLILFFTSLFVGVRREVGE